MSGRFYACKTTCITAAVRPAMLRRLTTSGRYLSIILRFSGILVDTICKICDLINSSKYCYHLIVNSYTENLFPWKLGQGCVSFMPFSLHYSQ